MAHLATHEKVQWSFAAKGVAWRVVGAGSPETLPGRHGGWLVITSWDEGTKKQLARAQIDDFLRKEPEDRLRSYACCVPSTSERCQAPAELVN